MIIAGVDEGKTGTVIEILPEKGKVMVKGMALITKHAKARKQGDVAGIKKVERYIQESNVMPVCSSCKKPTRIGSQRNEEGVSVRICKQCKEIF